MARTIVQTSCSRCGHDVEGYLSAPHDWRDRGGGTHCLPYRTRSGELVTPGGRHVVSRQELSRQASERRRLSAEERDRRAFEVFRRGRSRRKQLLGRTTSRAARRRGVR